MKGSPRIIVLLLVFFLVGGAITYFELQRPDRGRGTTTLHTASPRETAGEKEKRYERAKEISTPDGFINTDAISLAEHIGKNVILLDFWTYSCINCQRTLPYLNAWHEKYAEKGLVVIGVHTPEFQFEQKYENVVRAVQQFGVQYPVVLDNDYSTWTAYNNRYWPRKYLIDIDGFIVYDHIGEGGYDETEEKIQELLRERMDALGMEGTIKRAVSRPRGAEALDAGKQYSPEIYFGAGRNALLGNGRRYARTTQTLRFPETTNADTLYLEGKWAFQEQYAENRAAPARIRFRYRAAKVFMVAEADGEIPVRVFRDGKEIQTLQIRGSALYRLLDDDIGYGEHTIELFIEQPGLRAFTLTFG